MASSSRRSLVDRAKAALTRKPAPEKAAPAKKTAAKKSAVKKAAPVKKTAAKKTAAKKAAAKKAAPVKKAAVKKAAPVKKTAVKKAAPVKKTAAKKAAPVKKAAAKKTAVKKAAPVKKATAKKATPVKKSAPVKKAAPVKQTAPAKKAGPRGLVVLDTEDPWTKEELAEVKATLKADVKRLTEELAESEEDLAGMMQNTDGAGQDHADIGSASFERDQEMTIVLNARDMLEKSERALARIADKSYGVCESCGNPIGKNRLMAFPRAMLCMTCKQREERR